MARRSTLPLTLLLIILAAAASMTAWSAWQQRQLNRSSSEFAVAISLETLSSYSAGPLVEVADPSFLQGWDEDGLQRYIDLIAARLGALQSVRSISGGLNSRPLPFLPQEITAYYEIALQFPEVMATGQVTLARMNRRWRLIDFRVVSPRLDD